MTRLALNRDTHLTPEEIAAEALRCFDENASAPSIRQLASVLNVTPSAIYHHFASRAAIIQAAVDLVWNEAGAHLLELEPDPFTADPVEVLVTAGIVTRQTFGAHYQVAPFLTATPTSSEPLAVIVALMANLFERMGLDVEGAAAAFHTYASFTIGAVLFAATRRITNEELDTGAGGTGLVGRNRPEPGAVSAGHRGNGSSTAAIGEAIDQMIDISVVDPERDGKLFADGLRSLVAGLGPS